MLHSHALNAEGQPVKKKQGRQPTTGRYATREELVAAIIDLHNRRNWWDAERIPTTLDHYL